MDTNKKVRVLLCIFSAGLFLYGCIEFSSYTMKVNFLTGVVEQTYRNLTSNEIKLLGESDSVESDWAHLKSMAKNPLADEEGKSKGLESVTANLFEDDGVLSGTISSRFAKSRSTLEERLEILNRQLSGCATMNVVNGTIFMFTKDGEEMLSTNGKVMNTGMKQAVVTWPHDVEELEATFRGKSTRSLLPFFLKEKKNE